MKKSLRGWGWGALCVGSALAVVSCGGNDDEATTTVAPQSLGNLSLDCGTSMRNGPSPGYGGGGGGGGGYGGGGGGNSGSGQQQQKKQFQFQQKQSGSCNPSQKFVYKQSTVSDFDVKLDCDAGVVELQNLGDDSQQAVVPFSQDGQFQGKIQYQKQVQGDGRGNSYCWVQYEVVFDGKATCGGAKSVDVSTQVSLQRTTPDALEQVGISPSPSPLIEPSPEPSPSEIFASPEPEESFPPMEPIEPIDGPSSSPIPSMSPSMTPSPMPSFTRSPRPSPRPSRTHSPRPSPSPTLRPVVICAVENPCPYQGTAQISCPQ